MGNNIIQTLRSSFETIWGLNFLIMKNDFDYIKTNKQTWNNKTAIHIESEFYNNNSFLEGKSTLNSIELSLLGDIKNKKILHLQCHFGQDTMTFSDLAQKLLE